MALLGESVRQYPDCITRVRPWQPDHEVHADVLPGCPGEGKWSEQPKGCVPGGSGAAAGIAVMDEPVGIRSHGLSVVLPLERPKVLCPPGVSEGGGDVMALYKVEPQLVVFRDEDATPVKQDPLPVLTLSLGELRVSPIAARQGL